MNRISSSLLAVVLAAAMLQPLCAQEPRPEGASTLTAPASTAPEGALPSSEGGLDAEPGNPSPSTPSPAPSAPSATPPSGAPSSAPATRPTAGPKPGRSPSSTAVPAVVDKLKKDYKVSDPLGPMGVDVHGLGDLVALQRRYFPGAVVVSGYYDWRTTSRYRSHAGLHLGYDIAMPYATPFAAGWAGTVVSIANWYGEEYGITVASPGGFEVTYGHVSPNCHVGQAVMPGDVLGTIAYNHVDVKMRDAVGNYIAFGEGADIPASPLAGLATGSTDSFLVTWLVARNGVEVADGELAMRKWNRVKLKADAKRLKSRVPELERTLRQMQEYAERGLVARNEVEQARQELEAARKRTRTIGPELDANARELVTYERQRAMMAGRLHMIEAEARGRGLSWKDVESLVNRVVARNPGLAEEVMDYKKQAVDGRNGKIAELKKKVEDGRDRLKKLEELYEMGGLPRVELEAAREKQKALENQLKSI